MKKASILACSLLFVSIAGFGQTQSQPPLSKEALAKILGLPVSSSCATRPAAVRQVAAKRPGVPSGKSDCTATANCGTGNSPVTCTGSGSCIAVDRDCLNNEPGYANCAGNVFSCSPAQCDCSAYTGINRQCCTCAQTGDCVACCRCDGFSLSYCSLHVCL